MLSRQMAASLVDALEKGEHRIIERSNLTIVYGRYLKGDYYVWSFGPVGPFDHWVDNRYDVVDLLTRGVEGSM